MYGGSGGDLGGIGGAASWKAPEDPGVIVGGKADVSTHLSLM